MTEFVSVQAFRVLLVSAEQRTRDAVEEALRGWSVDQQLFWVSQPDLAPTRSQDLLPHVILVDNELGRAHATSLIRELSALMPGVAIVALVEQEAIGGAREAVLAGARSFVTKPLDASDLVATVQQAVASRHAPPQQADEAAVTRGRVVVFCAPKGGTGRTTLAINSALSLRSATGQPVALVDADYAAPALDVAMGLQSDRNVADILPQILRLDADLVSGVLAQHASGVQVLLAPPPDDLSNPISLPEVQQILVLLKRMFPWVLVDLGLPLRETAFAFLDSADRIVMTVLPEMVGLRNTRVMLDQLAARGYPADKVWLVLNRSTMPRGVSIRDIETRLRMRVTHRVPDDQPLVTRSVNRGVPLVMTHKRSAVGRAIRGLAKQLAADVPRAAEVEDSAVLAEPGLQGARTARA